MTVCQSFTPVNIFYAKDKMRSKSAQPETIRAVIVTQNKFSSMILRRGKTTAKTRSVVKSNA